ncbi:IMPACT family protein [Pararhodonellum marinum]|uniref:IMPACT family protein n=1 Tax=Pararhodonellum marinum TaxID=2755358 RepID=UPI00188F3EC3|nr:YigZ family protein [Pararhodonellum marinum]
METDTYLTLKNNSESSHKERGSKFLGFAYPVKDEEDVKEKLGHLRKKYHDAHHHCYAYLLGKDHVVYRANDDGEPNHSAGDPILGQIKSFELTQVLIVVVRYFGGTKLGVGGLIQAYRQAALETILANEIVEAVETLRLSFNFEYPDMNEIMKITKDEGLEIIQQKFEITCSMTLNIRKSSMEQIKARLSNIASVTFSNHGEVPPDSLLL